MERKPRVTQAITDIINQHTPGAAEHRDHCDCYRQSRLSNASWAARHLELLARVEVAERDLADRERVASICSDALSLTEYQLCAQYERLCRALRWAWRFRCRAEAAERERDGYQAEFSRVVDLLHQAERVRDELRGYYDAVRNQLGVVVQRLAAARAALGEVDSMTTQWVDTPHAGQLLRQIEQEARAALAPDPGGETPAP